MIFGPDAPSLLLSMFLIAGPSITFCIQVSLKIIKHEKDDISDGVDTHILLIWIPSLLVAIFVTVAVSDHA